jgi:hypothetical protein
VRRGWCKRQIMELDLIRFARFSWRKKGQRWWSSSLRCLTRTRLSNSKLAMENGQTSLARSLFPSRIQPFNLESKQPTSSYSSKQCSNPSCLVHVKWHFVLKKLLRPLKPPPPYKKTLAPFTSVSSIDRFPFPRLASLMSGGVGNSIYACCFNRSSIFNRLG